MHWVQLVFAIVMEVSGTISMKRANGFANLVPSILIFVFYGLAFVGLTLALRRIDVSVAYAIWSGVGTALVAVVGVVWFKEQLSAMQMASIALIVIGVVGLSLGEA